MHRAASLSLLLVVSGCGASVVETGDGGATTDSGSSPDTVPTDLGVPDTGAVDARPDIPLPDTGVPMSPECKAAGGALCTERRWVVCPPGYEPIGKGDGHLACDGGGWCCVIAPLSACTSSGKGNCVVGACTGCWAAVPDPSLSCEPGRSCCQDICD